jgi:predicted transcriptional regulator
MVAPNYTKHRSSLAKKIGLGTKPRGRPPGRGRGAAREA